ncbi:MAG: DegV family EDD domain-containing protein [Myxococcota bacterium]|jgi:hypothetical protein|nr:DegV family EDD domain-containing protein [Myxococcota bacterium]
MTHSDALIQSMLAGAADLLRIAPLLDRINVFPVADADTGTNLASTARCLIAVLSETPSPVLPRDHERVARAVLLGGRGNSGVIFAGFLGGLLNELGQKQTLDSRSLAAAISAGTRSAHACVEHPMDGTMLTLAKDLDSWLSNRGTPPVLEDHGHLELDLAACVARTPKLMPRLERAGVVDSGALGLHVFACGLTLAFPALSGDPRAYEALLSRIDGETTAPLKDVRKSIKPEFLTEIADEVPRYASCVTVLMESSEPLSAALRAALSRLSESLDIAQAGGSTKVHLHTHEAEAVIQLLRSAGKVQDVQVEDMAHSAAKATDPPSNAALAHSRIRIVSDSSLSLPRDLCRSLDLELFDNYVNLEGRTIRDRQVMLEELMLLLRTGRPIKTAQASSADVTELLDRHLPACDRLFYIAVGNAYTGTQALVRRTASNHPLGHKLCIIDTQAASGQQGLVCLAGARAVLEDHPRDADAMQRYLERLVAQAREYLVIDNLKYLSRTGRVGRIRAAVAGMLSVHPIVGHGKDGAVTHAKVRSHEEALETIGARIDEERNGRPLLVMIEHTDNLNWVETVRANLAERLGTNTEFLVSPLSSTSAVHMGPGTWGISVLPLPSF